MLLPRISSFFFFFNDTATTEIYTLSLHDALPISLLAAFRCQILLHDEAPDEATAHAMGLPFLTKAELLSQADVDRKSTRLNSSHSQISYAVFCLKKKKKKTDIVISI